MKHIKNKSDAYDNLIELLENQSTNTIVRALCNFYSTNELVKLSEFLSDELGIE